MAERAPERAYYDSVVDAVDAARDELVEISKDIHANPELNYEEHHAAAVLSDALERHGFAIERGVGGLPTAFRGVADGGEGGGPTVAILAEYDALPGIGHGCGHNLIAISALGAGLGAEGALGSLSGRLMVLGTPAEEGGGGKIRLLEAGLFRGVDVSLSSHPGSNRTVIRTDTPAGASTNLAMVGYRYVYRGKAAHAASAPHEGINALNAVIRLFSGIDALRQHLRDDVRIHGIITDGGTAANVVPEFAAANFMLRARDREYLRDVVVKGVRGVAEGAARMTGATLAVEPHYPFYDNVRPSDVLAEATRANARLVGIRIDEPEDERFGGGASTDFGNVSQAMPSFAMSFAISDGPIAGHSSAKAEASITDMAHASAIAVAKALALTACDLLAEPGLLADARDEFESRG